MADKKILIIDNFLGRFGKSPAPSEKLVLMLRSAGWQVTTASNKNIRLFRFFDVLMKCLRSPGDSITLISVYSGLYFRLVDMATFFLKILNKPYILVLHGGNLPRFAKRHSHRVRKAFSAAVAITAPSEYLRREMRCYSGREISIIPNGIEIEKYPFRLRKRASPKLFWLRSFHELYNPQLAIEVLALLTKDFPDIHLRMIGPEKDGSYRRVVKKAEKLGLLDRIEFKLGVDKSDVPLWLDREDIFINTTNIDNTPVSVIEAMACGLCVVSTNVGGLPYLLEDGADALLVPPRAAQAMANALRRILTEPGLAEKLSGAGRRKAEGFDWNLVQTKWLSLLQ